LKSLAALLVCGVHSQSDGFKSALASFIARSSTRTSPRFGLRSGVKAAMLGSLAQADVLRCCIESTGAYQMPVLCAWKAIPCVVNPLLAPYPPQD